MIKPFLSLFFIGGIATFLYPSMGLSEAIENKIEYLWNNIEAIHTSPPNIECFTENISELMQQCALNLCDEHKNTPPVSFDNSNVDQYINIEKFIPMEDKIRWLASYEWDKIRKLDNLIKVRLDEDPKLIDKVVEKNNFWYTTRGHELFAQYIDKMIVDHDKPLNERISFIVKAPENSSERFKKMLDLYVDSRKKTLIHSFNRNPLIGISQGFYSDEEADKILAETWNKLYSIYLKKKEEDPNLLSENSAFVASLKEQYSGKTNLDNDLKAASPIGGYFFAVKTVSDLNRFKSLINTDQRSLNMGFKSSPSDYDDNLIKYIDETYHEIIKERWENLIKEDKEKTIDRIVAECKVHFATKYLFAPQMSREEVNMVGKAFLKNVLPRYSKDTAEILTDYFHNTLKINTPVNANIQKPNDIKDIDLLLKKMIDEKQDSASSFPQKITEKDLNDRIAQITRPIFINESDLLPELDFCGTGNSSKVFLDASSYFDPNRSEIIISPLACTHFDHFGKFTLAHELGHALSHVASEKKFSRESYDKFKKDRSCVTDLYKNETRGPIYSFSHDGDHLYSEEDHADIFAYMSIGNEAISRDCSLLFEDGELTRTVDIFHGAFNPETHSTNFLRLLRNVIHTKIEIPLSCQKVIDRYKDQLEFASCF